jgi:hypothetical protein
MKFVLHIEEGEVEQSHMMRCQGKTTWRRQIFYKWTLTLLHQEALGRFHPFMLGKLRARHPRGPLSHGLGPRVCFAYVSIRPWLQNMKWEFNRDMAVLTIWCLNCSLQAKKEMTKI